MTTQEIIDGVNEYLGSDIGYQLNLVKDSDGRLIQTDSVYFTITNVKDDTFFAPFFPVESIEQARDVAKEVLLDLSGEDEDIDRFIQRRIEELRPIDETKPMYLTLYRPERVPGQDH